MLPVYLSLLSVSLCVKLIYYKENIMIPKGSYHSALVQLTRHNSELISAEISISNTVRNSLPTISDYMDYFPNLNQQDQACYLQAITRQSYLFPCPFVTTGNPFIRQNQIKQVRQMKNLPIQQINKVSYKALIDNTEFPFPEGAIPYNALHLDTATYITVTSSSSSYRMTKLFFFINVTALIIFLVIVGTLLVKNHLLLKKMRSTQDKPVEESDTSFQQNYSRDSSLISSKATLIKRNEFAETE